MKTKLSDNDLEADSDIGSWDNGTLSPVQVDQSDLRCEQDPQGTRSELDKRPVAVATGAILVPKFVLQFKTSIVSIFYCFGYLNELEESILPSVPFLYFIMYLSVHPVHLFSKQHRLNLESDK